jgi:putative MATE family efflux protein
MAFGALYQIADGLFVGRFIGEDALAAVNLIMPIIMMVFAFSNMIATGASVRISILLGEKNREEASRVFAFSIKFILLMSCVIGAVGLIFAEPFVRMLAPGATEDAIKYGITYLRVYAAFSPLLPIYFATDNYLRVCGKEKLSMWLSIGTQSLNILLDVILIAVLGQGIWAAAFTSCVAMAFGSVITLLLFCGGKMDLYYAKGGIPMSVFVRILANGSSEFFNNISMSVMSVVYNFFLLEYGGTTGLAAFSVVMYVDSIIGMLVFGMCDALQPAISYLYGAGLMDKVKAIFKRIIVGAAILSSASMLFMMFLGEYVAPLFVKPEDTELLAVSIIGMKLFSFSYLTGWVDMCFSSYFTALERPARSLVTSFFGTLVFPIGFLFILSPSWQLNGVWLTPLFSCTASAVFTVILASTMKSKTDIR